MARILSIGYLRDFLEQRAELLHEAGHSVHNAATRDEAAALLAIGNYDVCIFGHGVPENERNEMAAASRSTSPNVALIFLYSGQIRRAELADAVLNFHSSLPDLVQTVDYLVSKKQEARTIAPRARTG